MPPTKPTPFKQGRASTSLDDATPETPLKEIRSSSVTPTGRLSSLSKRTTPGGPFIPASPATSTPGTPGSTRRAFTPKQVTRRSKETRDSSAPASSKVSPVVVAPPSAIRGSKNASRTRGTLGRRGKGRYEQFSTTAVGAFSSIGTNDSRSAGPAQEFNEKSNQVLPTIPKGEVDEDVDASAINMTRSIGKDQDDFFPIRPIRDEQTIDGETQVKHENSLLASIQTIDSGTYTSPEEQLERAIAARDHTVIANEFRFASTSNLNSRTGLSSDENSEPEQKLFFFQMPVIAPEFEAEEEELAEQRSHGKSKQKRKTDLSKQETQYPEGIAGKLRVHKSGKLTMLLGNIVMDISQGTDAEFLQDVVALSPEDQKAVLLGQIRRKMIVSPDIEELLKS